MDVLHRLRHLDRSSPEFPDQVRNLLYEPGYRDYVTGLQDLDDPTWLLEFLDNVRLCVTLTDSPPKLAQALSIIHSTNPASFRKCLLELRTICSSRNILPQSYTHLGSPPSTHKWPIAARGACDVYEGSIDNSKVCVKRLRIYSSDGPEKAKHVCYQHITPFSARL